MHVTASQLTVEIREVEGLDVVFHSTKPGQLFPSYKARWPVGLDDGRNLSAFKRRLEHCITGHSYGVLNGYGQKLITSGKTYLSTIRGKTKP